MRNKTLVLDLQFSGLWPGYQRLTPGRKFIVAVLMIWLIQALPKWTVAVTADGEVSAQIMKIFITPRTESMGISAKHDGKLVAINKPDST